MKCFIYLRVSTKEQAEKADSKEGYSIPAQRDACARYIKDHGWELADEFVDRGESARTANRPQLKEMLREIKKRKDIGAVVVHKIDRLARSMEDHVAIKAILKKADATLVSVVEHIEDNAQGRFMEGIHALMAEYYSDNLGSETKKGMTQKAKMGGWPEMAPLGYLNVQTPMHGKLLRTVEVDEERAPFVIQVFELYATGDIAIPALTKKLYKMGFRSRGTAKSAPCKVSQSRIESILKNPFYKGIVRWNGIETKGIHKPLVSEELWDRVQDVRSMKNFAGPRLRKHPHYLRGTLYCGECGAKLSSLTAKGSYLYFYCLGQKNEGNGCTQKYIKIEDLEEAIADLYQEIQMPRKLIEGLRENFRQELLKQENSSAKEQEFITRRMAKLAGQRSKILDAFYAGAVTTEVLKEEQDRIAKEMGECQNRMEILNDGEEEVKETLNRALDMASKCHAAYSKAKPEHRRLYNQAFFRKIYVKDGEVSGKEFTSLFNMLFDKSSNKKDLVAGVGIEPTTSGL